MHKIERVQSLLKQQGIQAFLLPNCDEFQNEYLPDYNKRIEWLTGFTGSAATVIITPEKCIFMTDGRYTLQADQELDAQYCTIVDMRPWQWLQENKISELWYDAALYTEWGLQPYIKSGIILQEVEANPVDALWVDRPKFVPSHIIDHSLYAGRSSVEKCQDMAGDIAFFIADPAAVCWLLNIRGHDVEHTPLVFSYAILYPDGEVALFLPEPCQNNLGEHVTVYDFASLPKILTGLSKVALDPDYTTMRFIKMLDPAAIVRQKDPCQLAKACKNSTELAGIATAHQRDGVAKTKFLYWLQHNDGWSEKSAAAQLLQYRQEQDLFQEPSFSTISAFAEHGAIVHYSNCTDTPIAGNNLYLVDSGGQYLNGTTDVTRTIAIGDSADEQKHYYTLVLKGHIALAMAIFPTGTSGKQLEVLARQYLWRHGQNYRHGTGHGVGHYLGVHEGPQGFHNDVPLKVGMILSNEPGFYLAGGYGIRIENLMRVVEEGEQYLGFEILTCLPIDLSLVKRSLLRDDEIAWLHNYHQWVYDKIHSGLDDNVKKWVQKVMVF